MEPLLLLLIFVLCLALGQAALWAAAARGARPPAAPLAWDREPPLSRIGWLAKALAAVPGMLPLRSLQSQAGSTAPTVRLVLLSIGLAAAPLLASLALLGDETVAAALAIVGASSPPIGLLLLRARRAKAVSAALPDSLSAFKRLLRGGKAPAGALLEVARATPGPLGRELARVHGEQGDGRPLTDALAAMAERLPASLEARLLAIGVSLAERSGGDLATMIERLEATIRQRIDAKRSAWVEATQARGSAAILCALPPLGAAALLFFQPSYLLHAWDDPAGRALLQLSAGWMALGMVLVAALLRTSSR